jgi:hypothetical protein
MAIAKSDESGIATIEENREAIESIAESDLPAARVATALLEVAGE